MSSVAVDPLRLVVPADPAELRRCRHAVQEWLALQGAPPEAREDAVLVISELVTNAIEAAPGTTVEVAGEQIADEGWWFTVANTVNDPGDGAWADPAAWRLPDDDLQVGGRGLPIVRAIASDLQVVRTDDSTSVRAMLLR